MAPTPFQIPIGGIATIKRDEEDAGYVSPHYLVRLFQQQPKLRRKPAVNAIELKFENNGVMRAVGNYLEIYPITEGDIKQKLAYWHAIPPVLYFTFRPHFQLSIQYPWDIWNHIKGDFNFDVYNIDTPDYDSSSSEGETINPGQHVTIPGADIYPFYRAF